MKIINSENTIRLILKERKERKRISALELKREYKRGKKKRAENNTHTFIPFKLQK
jgi:hypothetical protein